MAASKGPDHYRRRLTTVRHLGCRRCRPVDHYSGRHRPVSAGFMRFLLGVVSCPVFGQLT